MTGSYSWSVHSVGAYSGSMHVAEHTAGSYIQWESTYSGSIHREMRMAVRGRAANSNLSEQNRVRCPVWSPSNSSSVAVHLRPVWWPVSWRFRVKSGSQQPKKGCLSSWRCVQAHESWARRWPVILLTTICRSCWSLNSLCFPSLRHLPRLFLAPGSALCFLLLHSVWSDPGCLFLPLDPFSLPGLLSLNLDLVWSLTVAYWSYNVPKAAWEDFLLL